MATAQYPALLYGGPHGFGVIFPDLPGCVSDGGTLQEAGTRAAEALALHLEGMAEASEPLPTPSPLDAPLPEWMAEEGEPAARVLVPAELPRQG